MKSSLLLVLLFFLITTLLAQSETHFSKDSDTAFWYRYKNDDAKQFKLGFIEADTADYSFRFWSSGLVVKITNNAGSTTGEIIRFTEAYPSSKGKKFVKRYPISTSKAIQVRYLIDSLQIEFLPSDKNISGWQHGFDGIEYFTEFKRNGQYSFKNYWTPTAQDTLREAIQFQKFVLGLDSMLDLKANSKEFQDSIPFDSWSNPGSGTNVIRVKPKTKRKHGG
jgi:hypothetical protein